MSNWSFISATPQISDRNDKYGHNFGIKFKLKYTPSRFGSFKEMPKLEWKEVIFMKLHHDNTYWQHTVDQYARNPRSPTFSTWVPRYKNMYFFVRGQVSDAKLFDAKGVKLPPDTFPRGLDYQDAADAVRNYLQRYGGVVEILVNDTPAIGKPAATDRTHKERVLTFDCGLAGMGTRTYAYQYLDVDSALPEARWQRKCELSSVSAPMAIPKGYQKVPAPNDVTEIKPFGAQQKGDYE